MLNNSDLKYCRGCDHLCTCWSIPTCDYYLNTGKRRPCPSGEGCTEHTEFEKRRRAKERAAAQYAKRYAKQRARREEEKAALQLTERDRKPFDQEQARKLFDEGYSDRGIAAKLGITERRVKRFRLTHGLKRKRGTNNEYVDEDPART